MTGASASDPGGLILLEVSSGAVTWIRRTADIEIDPGDGLCQLPLAPGIDVDAQDLWIRGAIEDIDPGPVEAIRAVGGNDFQVMIYGILPQVLPQILSVIVFEWEINIRRSAILGLVGAGGLGLVFFRQMNTFNYYGVTSVIIAILFLILLGEIFSYYSRKAVI
jgi:hypothetical protein